MYVKLFTSIYQGTLRGNSNGLLVFTNMLAHCDAHGNVDMHPRAIAEEVGLTQEQVRSALDFLESPEPESRSQEEEGRRIVRLDEHRSWGWRVVNYAKYRAIRSEDDRRAANRAAVAKHRAGKAASSPVIACNPKSSPSPQEEAEGEAEAKEEKQPPAPAGPVPRQQVGATKSKREKLPAVQCPEHVSERVWADWMALRKAKRAPVTQTAVDDAEREARKAGMTLEAFLVVWCGRGSQGLRADWLKPHERGSPGRGADRVDRQLETAALMTGSFRDARPFNLPEEVFDAEQQRITNR